MCAVPGTSKRISVTMLIGVPPIAWATWRANSLACGMKVGMRCPWLRSTRRKGQQPHGVGPRRIARGLDVRVLVQVEAGADGNTLRQVVAATGHAHPDQRLG